MGKKNIILIGMPGSGKSTIGVVLAKILGFRFIDSDLVIQEKEGRLLKDIIKEDGIDAFIELENRINKKIEAERTIIATGGSAVYGSEAMRHFMEIGTVIYIKYSYEVIDSRLSDLHKRGVVIKDTQSLYDLYNERTPLYEKYANIIIDGNDKNISEMAELIIKRYASCT